VARKRRDSAIDALRRPEINLIAARLAPPIARNLDFGRSILDSPERMELRYDCCDPELHLFGADEAGCYACGPQLADLLAILRGSVEKGLGKLGGGKEDES